MSVENLENRADAYMLDHPVNYGDAFAAVAAGEDQTFDVGPMPAGHDWIAELAEAESASRFGFVRPEHPVLNGIVESDPGVPIDMDRRLHVLQTLRALQLLGEVSKRRAMDSRGARASIGARHGSDQVDWRVQRALANADDMEGEARAAYAMSHNDIAFGGLSMVMHRGWQRFTDQYAGPDGRLARDRYKTLTRRIAGEQGIPLPR